MFIVKNRRIFYTFSIILIVFSLFSIFHWGLNFGIDFKGGSLVQVQYNTDPGAQAVTNRLNSLGLSDSTVRETTNNGYIIRTRTLSDAERQTLTAALLSTYSAPFSASSTAVAIASAASSTSSPLQLTGTSSANISTSVGEITQFDSVGPVLGQELQGKAIWSIILVMLAIVIFITFVFRKVSEPVASWKYGVVAIIALMHDIIIPTGIFAFIGRTGSYEIDALFVTAILVILGFSVHDTIVVFDRTRENLRNQGNTAKKSFEQIVGESVSQTIARSINTSLTTVLALIVLFVIGPDSTHDFALALIIGIITGTYSSIFIGSPLLVTLEKWQSKKK